MEHRRPWSRSDLHRAPRIVAHHLISLEPVLAGDEIGAILDEAGEPNGSSPLKGLSGTPGSKTAAKSVLIGEMQVE